VGTLLFAKIPQGSTASFRILTTIRGKIAKTYKITITRINYKLNLTDPRYQQYIKPIVSDSVTFL
jgi:predicted transcriptional regulator